VFREIAEQILPALGVEPDIETTAVPELIARADKQLPSDSKLRDEQQRVETERRATLPTVVSNGGREGEVVYAATTSKAIVMPDLHGRSVRDVARTCAQLGLQIEARGEGRVLKQNPAPGAEVSTGQVIYLDFGRAN
jgi:PASTA domain-containing protein